MSGFPVPFVSPDMPRHERLVAVVRACVARASINPVPQDQFYRMCEEVVPGCTCGELEAALEYVRRARDNELAARGAS